MSKPKRVAKKAQKTLDAFFGKRGRGRPAKVSPSEVRNRSAHYRLIFRQAAPELVDLWLKAKTTEDVIQALDASPNYKAEFGPIAPLILRVLRERGFPKRRDAQINFLADSLAGWGRISPRRSRDICQRERIKEKRAHHIIRREFYVECSCGYKGPARDNACRKCGAKVPAPIGDPR